MSSRLQARPGRRTTVVFPHDPNDHERHQELATALSRAKTRLDLTNTKAKDPDRAAAALAELSAAESAVDDAQIELDAFLEGLTTMTWHVHSIGAKKAERLMAKHPASTDQQKRFAEARAAAGERGGFLQFNEDDFPPALIAAATTKVEVTGQEPVTDLTAEEIAEQFESDGWATGDIETLFVTCQVLCQVGTTIARSEIDRLGKG